MSCFCLCQAGTPRAVARSLSEPLEEWRKLAMGRSVLLWLLGVPIPVIIILWLLFGH